MPLKLSVLVRLAASVKRQNRATIRATAAAGVSTLLVFAAGLSCAGSIGALGAVM